MKKMLLTVLSISMMFSCDEDPKVSFTEYNLLKEDNVLVEINIPQAEGDAMVAQTINNKLQNHIANMLNFSEDDSESIHLEEAIANFEKTYLDLKRDFEESTISYEATFDGEVIFESSEVISIALTGYLYTGGAHGNTNITLYNFNAQSGALLKLTDFISDEAAFTAIAQTHFEKAVNANPDTDLSDYFFGETFHLPENIGLNSEGILLLYNQYEVASYATGITQFTIPFDEVIDYLWISPMF